MTAAATAAWAQTESAAVAPRRVVAVTVIGSVEDAKVLEASIRDLLSRLQLTMASEKTAPSSALLETVVIDLTYTYGTKVVVTNAAGKTVLDRTIQHADTPAIQREQIAHAVRGAAEAELLEDQDRVAGRAPPVAAPTGPVSTMQPLAPTVVDPPPAPPPPPAPVVVTTIVNPAAEKPIAKPQPAGPIALEVSTFAGGGMFANESPVARVGGAVALMSRKGWRPSIALAGLYAFPFDDSSHDGASGTAPSVTSRTKLLSIRALAGIGLWRYHHFGVDVAAGAGIDTITVEPSSSSLPDTALASSSTRVDFVMAGQATGYWAIADDVSLTLSAVVDVDPLSRAYVFENRGATDEILSPWHVRPMLLAGLSFTALGAPR